MTHRADKVEGLEIYEKGEFLCTLESFLKAHDAATKLEEAKWARERYSNHAFKHCPGADICDWCEHVAELEAEVKKEAGL